MKIAQLCQAPASWEVLLPPPEPTYRDPFAYCGALGTVDFPREDPKYRGAHFGGGTAWRCMDGEVLRCNIGTGLFCYKPDAANKTPPPFLIDYCATATNQSLPTAATPKLTVCIWECREGKPVIVGERAVDSRGFDGTWEVVPGPTDVTYADPFAYCRYIGTIDRPDLFYVGVHSPEVVRKFVHPDTSATTFIWRCADARVLACATDGGLHCIHPRTSVEPGAQLLTYCMSPGGYDQLAAAADLTAYEWECRDGKPVIVRKAALDAQGYRADEWRVVVPEPAR